MSIAQPERNRSPSRPRWFQYSLRALLVMVILASVAMSWLAVRMQQARRQRALVEAIENRGGVVLYDCNRLSDGTLSIAAPKLALHRPTLLERWLGQDCFYMVVAVYFDFSPSGLTDSQLTGLVDGFSQLEELSLVGTEVTDDGIKRLQEALPNCKIRR